MWSKITGLKHRIDLNRSQLSDRFDCLLYRAPPVKSYSQLKSELTDYLKRCQIQQGGIEHEFSEKCPESNLYSVTSAYLLKAMLGIKIGNDEQRKLREYIRGAQEDSGLFWCEKLNKNIIVDGDHFGRRHITLMLLPLFDYYDFYPRRRVSEFVFRLVGEKSVKAYCEDMITKLQDPLMMSNHYMNVCGCLQYSRDFQQDVESGLLLSEFKEWAIESVLIDESGLFWQHDIKSQLDINRSIKATYHYAPIYEYDHDPRTSFTPEMERLALKNQRDTGSFGEKISADACDDIDSIYFLSKTMQISTHREDALGNAVRWIYFNQCSDGGFSFVRNRSVRFGGHPLMCQERNKSNIYSTWFRVLALAFAYQGLSMPNEFCFSNAPGYQFWSS